MENKCRKTMSAPLKLLGPSQHYRIEEFKGCLNFAPLCRETPVSEMLRENDLVCKLTH